MMALLRTLTLISCCLASFSLLANEALELNYKLDLLQTHTDSKNNHQLIGAPGDTNISNVVFRPMLQYAPSENWQANMHVVLAATHGDIFKRPDFSSSRYRAANLYYELASDNDDLLIAEIDRFNWRYFFDNAELIVGRQAVTFGKAFFYNPLDVFRAFDPAQVDRDFKSGVDAIRLDWFLGDLSGLNLLAVPGRASKDDSISYAASALLGRYYRTIKDWDFALQAGKIYGGYQLGTALSGDLAGLEFRAEAAQFFADDYFDLKRNALDWVIGTGYRFANSLHLELEYFRNALGSDNDLGKPLILANDGLLKALNKHLIAASASYEILPILQARLSTIYAPNDGSYFLQGDLNWSLADEIDLLIVTALNRGAKPTTTCPSNLCSEFGAAPDVFFLQLRWYF